MYERVVSMAKKEKFIHKFMRFTGKTSAVLGPANRSFNNHQGKHRKPSVEEVEANELTANTWEIKTTDTGERYVVDIEKDKQP